MMIVRAYDQSASHGVMIWHGLLRQALTLEVKIRPIGERTRKWSVVFGLAEI